MELRDAIEFWANTPSEQVQADPAVLIDAESIPGWVIALRCPPDRPPYVELWWEGDFIEETKLHHSARPGVGRDLFARHESPRP